VRLTESGNARSKQLLVMPTDLLTNREWLPGELLRGLELRRPGWFLDIKYHTCLSILYPGLIIELTYGLCRLNSDVSIIAR